MGRGRAKAKQTRVARDLKYSSPNTDLERLQRELSSVPSRPSDSVSDVSDMPEVNRADDDTEDWSGYADPDEDKWASSAS